jgi:hypothetical protein
MIELDHVMPETSSELVVNYAYDDEDGKRVRHEMRLAGENAEDGSFIATRFLAFLKEVGFPIEVKPPVTVKKVVQAACALLLAFNINQTYRPMAAPRQHRLAVAGALIPMPTRTA